MKPLSALVLALGIVLLDPVAQAAPGDTAPPVTFRVLVAGPRAENGTLWLGAGDGPRMEVSLANNNLSQPYTPLGTQLDFYLGQNPDAKAPSVASASLPEGGEKFILLFIPKEGTPISYDLKVLADNTDKLPGAGAIFFNLSPYPVSGTIAETAIELPPGARQDLRISNLDPESPFRDVDLSYLKTGQKDRFFVTRWTFTKDKRFFIFLFWNPRSNSMNLKSIPDLIQAPATVKG